MSATSTQTDDNPVAKLQPRYIDGHGYEFTIGLGLDNPTVAELRAACDFLQREVEEREITFTAQIGDNSYELRGHYGYGGLTDDNRRQLEALVRPQYTAFGSAAAEVRRKNDKHTATIVRIDVTRGKANLVSNKEIEGVEGVLRANWLRNNTRVTFSLVNPTNEDVQRVTVAVAELLGLHIPQPVAVNDSNPDAALLPENDFKRLVVSAA